MAIGQTTLILFGISAAVGLILTPVAILIAKSVGLVDRPHVRKVHKSPVPRVGGVAIVLATALPLAVLSALWHVELGLASIQPALTLLVGAVAIAAIGLLDDLFDVPSKYKLLALLAASAAYCGAGGAVTAITLQGRIWLDLGLFGWPITMLWIVLVTVSINFIDGLDGLAGGIALIACGVLAISASWGLGDPATLHVQATLIATALAGALAAFLVFNRHPARVFMGDCGSMFIGFLLAGSCTLAAKEAGTTRGVLLPALALSIPLCDTLLTMVRRRVLQRSSVFAAERGHVHHRLLDTGLIHRHVVILLHGVTLAAAVVAIICVFSGFVTSLAAAIVFGFGLVVLFRFAGSVRARETLGAIRRNRAMDRETKRYQTAFHELQLQFREVNDFDGWWKAVCRAAEVLDFAKVDLPLTRRDGSEATLKWRRNAELLADASSITAEVPIPQRRSDTSLRAGIEVIVQNFLESGGQRIALFSRLMGEFGLNQIKYHADKPAAATAKPMAPAAHKPGPLSGVRIALVHDFLYTYAGAERVLEQMLAVFPHADLFSLFDFLPPESRGFLGNRPVQSSFLQKLPFARSKHRAYLPLMPLAIEHLDVSAYDIVISSSYLAAKGVLTRADQLHLCYCHTPVRFAWDLQQQYLAQVGLAKGVRSFLAKMVLHYIRNWDVRSANGVDVFLANSSYVGRRIRKIYRRESSTVHPPVDTDFFTPGDTKADFYLTASRLVPYKRVDLIVEAFRQTPERRLVVVGEGPELERIRAVAGPNVTLVGHQSADELRQYMRLAKAFVFAAEEDFGISPVEAMACGTPVIAYGRGGVTETVVDGVTGLFFAVQDASSILESLDRFESIDWNAEAIRKHAEQFSITHFRESLAAHVELHWQKARFQENEHYPHLYQEPISLDG